MTTPPAITGPRTGTKMCLYLNTATPETPTWLLFGAVGDVRIPDLKWDFATLERRSSGFAKIIPSMIAVMTVEFRFIHGLEMTNFTQLRELFFAATPREWAVMNELITRDGAQGLRLPAVLTDFPWDQPLKEISGHDCKLTCAYMEAGGVERDPVWHTTT